MNLLEVRVDPRNNVIFERPLDDLMKQVRCKHLVYVGSRETVSKWLEGKYMNQQST